VLPSRPKGFSLIEVLFALAVVGLTLGAAAGVFGAAWVGHATGEDADHALVIAENALAAAGAEAPLGRGMRAGKDGRFTWQVAVAPYDDRESPQNFVLYRIEARVSWRNGVRERRLALATLRLAPAPPP